MTTTTTMMAAPIRAAGRATPPVLAAWVELNDELCHGGRRHIVAVNHRDGIALQLSEAEAAACSAEVGTEPEPATGSASEHTSLLEDLRRHGFLSNRPLELDASPAPRSRRQRFVSALRSLDVSTGRADTFVRRLHRRFLHHLFTPAAVAVQLALAAAGCVALALLLRGASVDLRATPEQIPVFIALGLLASFVHELGHAVVLVHYGRSVRSVGLRLHLGNPAFYVDSLDGLLLTRPQRLLQAAAGPWAEWLFTSAIALSGLVTPGEALTVLLVRFSVVNTYAVVSNLLPFVGLDGQLLLGDIVRVPDLSTRSKDALLGRVGDHTTRRETSLLTLYATLNALVAALLLLAACFFWYQLFGNLVGSLLAHGPVGWVALTGFTTLCAGPLMYELGRRAVSAAPALVGAAVDQWERARFRLERRWRAAAMEELARLPELIGFDEGTLGVLAGYLQRLRVDDDGWLDVPRPAFATSCGGSAPVLAHRFSRPSVGVACARPLRLRGEPGARVALLDRRRVDAVRSTKARSAGTDPAPGTPFDLVVA